MDFLDTLKKDGTPDDTTYWHKGGEEDAAQYARVKGESVSVLELDSGDDWATLTLKVSTGSFDPTGWTAMDKASFEVIQVIGQASSAAFHALR